MSYLDVPVAMVTVFKNSSVIVRESEGETPAPISEQRRLRQLTMRAPCFFQKYRQAAAVPPFPVPLMKIR